MPLPLLALAGFSKMQGDKAIEKAESARKGGGKSGAGEDAQAAEQNSLARIQQAIDDLGNEADPLDVATETVGAGTVFTSEAARTDRRRKKQEERKAMSLAENPRGTGLQHGGSGIMGGRKAMESAMRTQQKGKPSKLRLGSL